MWGNPKAYPNRAPGNSVPPEPRGELLARFPRLGPDRVPQELRVVLDEFEGHPFIGLRIWQSNVKVDWYPVRGKGLSIRMGEAWGVAEALLAVLDAASRPDREPCPAESADGPLSPR